MHLYEADVEKARKAVSEPSVVLEPFDEMPRGSLEKVRQLCTWESRVRHTSAGFGKRDRDREVKELVSLGRFWEAFGRVVLAKAFINNKKFDLAQQVAEPTRGPLGQLLRLEMAEIAESPGALQPQLELRDSPIPPLSEEVLERMHTDRQARLEAEKTTAHFYLMMIGQNLSETPGPAER
jgi:hypothetical protein